MDKNTEHALREAFRQITDAMAGRELKDLYTTPVRIWQLLPDLRVPYMAMNRKINGSSWPGL